MSHWYPGRVIVPKQYMESHLKRFFIDYDSAWVLARHQGFVYFKVKWKKKGDMIARCAISDMGKYFDEQMFHDDMPYVSGPFKNVRVFPEDFFNTHNPVPGEV